MKLIRNLVLRKDRSVYLFIEFPLEKAKALALKEKYYLEVKQYHAIGLEFNNNSTIFKYTTYEHLEPEEANHLWRQLRGEGYTRKPKLEFIAFSGQTVQTLYTDD